MLEAIMAGLSILDSVSGTSSARKQGKIQSDYLKKASLEMTKAQDAFNQTLNPSLQSAVLEGRRASDIVSEKGQQDFMQLKKQQDTISGATGFASMSMDNDMVGQVRKAYTTKLEDLDIGLTKNLSSILSDFEKTKFEMQSQKEQLDMQRKLADQQSQSKYLGIFG
jgi:hypothetical protein